MSSKSVTTFTNIVYILSSLIFIGLVGCGGGGGGGSDPTPPAVSTGILVDSPVVGIHYDSQPSGKSGTTGAGGEYDYVAGDTVTFSIGALRFPPVAAAAVITPVTLAGATNITNQEATNIARLLQSLDEDGDLATINISVTAAAAVTQTVADAIVFDVDPTTFGSNAAVTTLVNNEGFTGSLVDATTAQTHVTETLASLNGSSIVGAWTDSVSPWDSSDPRMLVFYGNGTYISWQDTTVDAGCAPGGVEYGTYSYSGTEVTFTSIVDETANCGITNGVGTTTLSNVSISGDVFTIGTGVDASTLTRVDGGADSLVGAWQPASGPLSTLGIVFYANGFYMQWQGPDLGSSCPNGGAEYGTYTYTPTDTDGLAAIVLYDDNGDCGLSDDAPVPVTFHVSGDVLTIIDTETSRLHRVGSNVAGGSASVVAGATASATYRLVDGSTPSGTLTYGDLFDASTVVGIYELWSQSLGLEETQADARTVTFSSDGTGTILFATNDTQTITWTVDGGVLNFTETDIHGDMWYWSVTRIAGTEDALVEIITPDGQEDSADYLFPANFRSVQCSDTIEDFIVGKRINIGSTDSIEFNYDGTYIEQYVENGITYTPTGTYEVNGLVVTVTYDDTTNHSATVTFSSATPTAGDTFAFGEYIGTTIDYSNLSTPVSSIESIGNICL